MGEETKQEEEVKVEAQVEEKAAEETKEESKPASPVVLLVDLHCVGCSKKIERLLMKVRGVEAVRTDMGLNQVTIKGVVDPQALCNVIQKKAKRRATILSPTPPAEGEPTPQLVTSQVSEVTTVELNVDMHCEACALQLKKKILKMRGVQTAETDLGSGKVSVTGTMDAQRLVDYVYRRTRKQARIVPQPEPQPEPKKEEEEKKEEGGGEKPPEEAAAAAKGEEKQEENAEKKEEANAAEQQEEKKLEEGSNGGENKGGDDQQKVEEVKDDQMANNKSGEEVLTFNNFNEERNAKMMHYYHYQPLYVIERVPAPQLFSDENPNACCIT